ncbi:M28 family metallopeptidase [Gemmatimonas sp.]|uniref:M28 family metallopeptidase n=1 Tax=Gemmatimonas sp. TaxID=1962908 RepID=UPI0027BA9C79|nr:M28 family peptidase [Gemmatimonas sp.]
MRIHSISRLPAMCGTVAATLLATSAVVAPLNAQTRPAARPPARSGEVPAAYALIREADIKRDLYAMAGDAMRGREAGTPDEMRASIWVAEQLRSIGVKPVGDDGSYFQWFNMVRTRVSTVSSTGTLAGQPLEVWKDFVPLGASSADISGPVVWIANPADSSVDVRGKVVATAMLAPNPASIRTTTNSPEVRYTQAAVQAMQARFARRGAAGLVLVADATGDRAFDALAILRARGTYDVDRAARRFEAQPTRAEMPVPARQAGTPAVLVRGDMAARLQQAPMLQLHIRLERFETPSTNIVGVIPGTDPVLGKEYVLFSSHQDHDGVRYVINGDSVWAGADDNGTGSVALLASARAFAKQRAKRSILFVYHGAEERGLLGSRYHAAHPVVPLASIVAVLNGEMMGRNNPDSASLLGIQPPHRNSTELVNMALRANDLTGKFRLDSIWDRPTHPEGWYFRSDHVPYARLNVPSVMYTTNLHDDYHTPRDKPERIDYPKLTRMTRWMYLTGWFVANAPKRPGIDPGFKLER